MLGESIAEGRLVQGAEQLMVPVSSETTITRASVSSVSPIAARWRVPSSEESSWLVVRGKKHEAATICPPRMITDPS